MTCGRRSVTRPAAGFSTCSSSTERGRRPRSASTCPSPGRRWPSTLAFLTGWAWSTCWWPGASAATRWTRRSSRGPSPSSPRWARPGTPGSSGSSGSPSGSSAANRADRADEEGPRPPSGGGAVADVDGPREGVASGAVEIGFGQAGRQRAPAQAALVINHGPQELSDGVLAGQRGGAQLVADAERVEDPLERGVEEQVEGGDHAGGEGDAGRRRAVPATEHLAHACSGQSDGDLLLGGVAPPDQEQEPDPALQLAPAEQDQCVVQAAYGAPHPVIRADAGELQELHRHRRVGTDDLLQLLELELLL